MRSVRSSTLGTAGPESSVRCTLSGAGRSVTGIRSIVRIRSCQGASFVSRTRGMPCAGVNVGGWFASYARGGTKAEPSVSEFGKPWFLPPWPGPEAEPGAPGSAWTPAGTANSEVGCSPSGDDAGRSVPAGTANALCASSDWGFWSSGPPCSATA